jgi:adenylylsulfate kinase
LWLTGMSGAGKSTISDELMVRFRSGGARVELLDGDIVRTNLSQGLGFSREDRDTNVRPQWRDCGCRRDFSVSRYKE